MTAARTIVIAGASGFVGRHLVATWRAAGHRVRMIGRAPTDDARWAAPASLGTVLENSDLLVNLAGRSVSCRYTKRNADAIFSSRDGTTAALGRALSETRRPPALWVNASTGTIYRDARDRPMDELTGEIGSGFSVEVARAWEHELRAAFVVHERRTVSSDHCVPLDGVAYEVPRGLRGEIVVHRSLLDEKVWVLHDGRLVDHRETSAPLRLPWAAMLRPRPSRSPAPAVSVGCPIRCH